VSGDQLRLPLPEAPIERRLPERLRGMEATPIDEPFDDPDYFFEPWWPGVRATAFIESGVLRMQIAGLSDPLATFPELADLPRQVIGDALVLDGTLLVLDGEGRPDPDLLRERLETAGPSRSRRVGGPEGEPEAETPGRPAFVASDLLWDGGVAWTRRPFRMRRDRLAAVLPEGDRVIVGRGYPAEGTLVAEALANLGMDGLSARRLSAAHRAGPSGDAWLRAPIIPPEPRPRPTLALILRLPLELG
jgi:bifunctional non-homologous end joining protein LigD